MASTAATGLHLRCRGKCFRLPPPPLARRARQRYGAAWPKHLGVAWPPPLVPDHGSTFLGGSLLVVMAPRPAPPAQLQAALVGRDYLCGTVSEQRYVSRQLGFIPGNRSAFSAADSLPPDLEQQALSQGISYPPDCPVWASAVEDNLGRDRLYFFFRRLDLLGGERAAAGPAREENVSIGLLFHERCPGRNGPGAAAPLGGRGGRTFGGDAALTFATESLTNDTPLAPYQYVWVVIRPEGSGAYWAQPGRAAACRSDTAAWSGKPPGGFRPRPGKNGQANSASTSAFPSHGSIVTVSLSGS